MKKNLLVILSVIVANSYAGECKIDQLNPLFQKMSERSTLMVGVAAYKYNQKSFIYDNEQELKILNDVAQIANKKNLDTSSLMLFAQIQMDQAKYIQHQEIVQWKQTPSSAPDRGITPDIKTLRTQISQLDEQIYSLIGSNIKTLQACPQETIFKNLERTYNNSSIPSTSEYNKMIASALGNLSQK